MQALRISFLLAIRQIQRANRWTTSLIVFVMMLTFLNLIVVSGVLVGLPVGAEEAVRDKTLGEIVITARDDEDVILETEQFRALLNTMPEVNTFSIRYETNARVEANYQNRSDLTEEPNIIASKATGIQPVRENVTSNLSENLIAGSYLEAGDTESILLGALTIERYTAGFADITGALREVYPGDTVRVHIGNTQKEYTVKGIIDAKGGEISSSIFMHEQELRRLDNRIDRNADRIIIRTENTEDAQTIKDHLLVLGMADYAKIRTYKEALPKFITDIKDTFTLLGLFLGAIGIVVASITIFIIIFINAVSRRKQIGILKGIGMPARIIETAYVLQAGFYVTIGSALGALLVFGFLLGYFERNPIDFPFSDGILVATLWGTWWRFFTLLVVTLLAGFVPAWLIARGNTLNAILGRHN